MDYSILPSINASFNLLSSLLLIAGKMAQLRGQIRLHIRLMISALISSALFLTGYLIYHFSNHLVTRWELPGRELYLLLLISHVLLAIVMLPGIIAAVYFAARGRFAQHQTLVKWVWPVWLYVSVTGVVIYLLLYWVQPRLLS